MFGFGARKSHFDEPISRPTSYLDSFNDFVRELSQTIPLSEWATGFATDYTPQETRSIELVRLLSGTEGFVLSPHLEQPLKFFEAEIGLIRLARRSRGRSDDDEFLETECQSNWIDDDRDWLGDESAPANWKSIISTYLKAWLCNASPFVLLDIAGLLAQADRIAEARRSVDVALQFPQYARTKAFDQMEYIALRLTRSRFPQGPHRKAHETNQGIYSNDAIALLKEGGKRIQKKLERIASQTANAVYPGPQTDPYFDAVFGLMMMLSRTIPLSEWAQGIPSGYGLRESENINKTCQLVEEGLIPLARERRPRLSDASQFARGRYRPDVAAGVTECLQRLLAEIGLLRLARKLITEAYDTRLDENLLEDDLEPGKQPIGDIEDIVSAYLKAWLPNSNPFVLLELANFLTDQGHFNEANEALSAVETFPEYSKSEKSDEYEGTAQAIALETLPPDLVRSIKPVSLTEVYYSREALQRLLPTEIVRIQKKLGASLGANGDHRNAQLPGSPAAVPVSAKPGLVSDQHPSLTEMLEATLPGRWTVIKRRVRTNVYPSPRPGYEVICPEHFRFRKEYSEGYEYRHGAHSRHFDDAQAVKRLADNIGLAVEQCPPDCDCRIRKRIAEIDGPCCPS